MIQGLGPEAELSGSLGFVSDANVPTSGLSGSDKGLVLLRSGFSSSSEDASSSCKSSLT